MAFRGLCFIREIDAEERGLEHFLIYLHSDQTDQETKEALKGITKDEHFHRSYSRAALQAYAPDESEALLKKVRMRRYKEAWMRLARTIGTVMSGFWLQLVYFLLVFPFRIFTKPDKSGWTTAQEKQTLTDAKQQF